MSRRASEIIVEELESMRTVRVREVDLARGEIVSITKGLIDSGEIDIVVDNKDEYIM